MSNKTDSINLLHFFASHTNCLWKPGWSIKSPSKYRVERSNIVGSDLSEYIFTMDYLILTELFTTFEDFCTLQDKRIFWMVVS